MNFVKKLATAVLAISLVVCVTGCHKKNEVAVKIGDVKFTSAYYMCALINADTEARSKVEENLKDDEKADTSNINYYSKKIDKKNYVDWVKDTAMESLKKIAAYKIKCKEAKIKLKEEDESNAKLYASYYWSNYGYSQIYEPNGVSEETFTNYMVDSYYSTRYFEHVYGKGGKKEIPADEVKSTMLENFVIADLIEVSFSEKEESEITTLKEQFNAYADALKNGTKDFETVYHEYNGEEGHTDEQQSEDGESKPLDSHATILGTEDTAYASDRYDTVKAMAVNEVKIVEDENNAGLALIVKKDIEADPYYLDNLDLSIRQLVKQDEFNKDIEKFIKTLKTEKSDYAINQFKVKKIKYPEQAQQA
ncbi:MAG: hypothetical protein MJ076_03065 [Clostridia bacterium]|nr:hypothetical protein [Clostridia bacterium]